MNLVIVESPAKGRTIKNILGEGYEVLASFGHVRDLPPKELGVDIKQNFEPKYEVPARARKTIKMIKDAVSKSNHIYLATDYDREGEAIAWHIIQACGLEKLKSQNSNLKISRITFHEITKPAVLDAIQHPRKIDIALVDAQQGRRVLDRLVGYKLSPFLWQKVARGLSAGRVQSVAVRLIVEREREVKAFVPEEFWQIVANLSQKAKNEIFKAQLNKKDGQKIDKLAVKNKNEAEKISKDLEKADYKIEDIQKSEKRRYPSPPFTTSTLQQEAARKFHFSPKQTMKIAQDLYEDGLITYMRTDSVQVSSLAITEAQKVIGEKFGPDYLPDKVRFYRTRTLGAQEAHEAIRPTNLAMSEVLGDKAHLELYKLIWQRMLASQMKEAIFDETKVEINAKNYGFLASGSKIKFTGFLKVYNIEESNSDTQILPELSTGEILDLHSLEKNQKFTEPPARFTEGTLIKELEKRGIGRPSTYAPTLSTIIDRGYVEKTDGKLVPKEVGEIVNDLLVKHFPEIIDYNFTAKMEEEFDSIALGRRQWQKVISDFYLPFAEDLAKKNKEVSKQKFAEEETDKICPNCGQNLKIKLGRYGKFLACSGFPKCKYTAPLLANHVDSKKEQQISQELLKEKCPKCQKNLILKEGKFGPFLACEGFPKCKFTKNLQFEAKIKCPECQGKIVQKRTRKGKIFWGCANYPKCKKAFWDEPQEKKCPECGGVLTLNNKTKVLKCSGCDWKEENS